MLHNIKNTLKQLELLEEIHSGEPDYPECDMDDAIQALERGIAHIETFDWEQHAIDVKEGAIIDAQEARND
jgi:hypothetical protein